MLVLTDESAAMWLKIRSELFAKIDIYGDVILEDDITFEYSVLYGNIGSTPVNTKTVQFGKGSKCKFPDQKRATDRWGSKHKAQREIEDCSIHDEHEGVFITIRDQSGAISARLTRLPSFQGSH